MPEAVLSIIGSFVCTMVLGVIYLKNRHRERLALIQYNKDYTIFSPPKHRGNSSLKIGLLLLSIGAGLLIGGTIDRIFNTEPAAAFSFIFMFGGYALIFYHRLISKQEIQNISKNTSKPGLNDDDALV